MAPKRKRASNLEDSPVKKRKTKTPARGRGRPRKGELVDNHPYGEVDPDQFYRVRSILDEDAKRYKIDWEDGPRGEHYDPTWEPKENVNDAAIEDWEIFKAGRHNSSPVIESVCEQIPPATTSPRRKRGRPRQSTRSETTPEQAQSSSRLSSISQEEPELQVLCAAKTPESAIAEAPPEIPDSLSQTRLHDNPFHSHASPAAVEGVSTPARSRRMTTVQVNISPPRPRQQLDYSAFSSSQVISGTQTQPDDANYGSPEPEAISLSLQVDAAAASDLSQKHSAFEPDGTSSSEDISGSVTITTSSGVHTFPITNHLQSGTVIPDSQALNDSLSYVPSQSRSVEERRTDSSQSQPVATATTTTQSLMPVNSQFVPESSVIQQLEPQEADNAHQHTLQLDEIDKWTVASVEELSSPVEEAAEEVQDPVTPGVPVTPSSSTSSPPPTESPDKSQSQPQLQSQSQSQSQSQLLFLSQVDLSNARQSITPTQETVSLDRFATALQQSEQVTPTYDAPSILPSVERIVELVEAGSETPELHPSVQQDPESSLHFLTQIFPSRPDPAAFGQQDFESSVHLLTQPSPARPPFDPTSSSIPSIPSRSLPVIGDSAPVPLRASAALVFTTPEPPLGMSNVAATPTSSGSDIKTKLKERMSAARAANRANAAARADALKPASAIPARLQSPALQDREVRSPSMIPAVEPSVREAPEDAFRSERFPTLLPGDDDSDAPPFTGLDMEPIESASRDKGFRNVRHIPINFGEQQRDHYKQAVTLRKELINQFYDKIWPIDSIPAQNARKLLQQLRNVVTHPDLDNEETVTQLSQFGPELQAQWDSDCSTKFRFLSFFLATSQQYNLCTVLLVQPGRVVGMLQSFLKGINVACALADHSSTASAIACPVVILTTDQEAVNVPSPDLIIALQGSITDKTIEQFQSQLSRGSASTTPIPAFSLIVPKTVEHIQRILPVYETEATRLHVLVATTASLRSEAGRDRDSGDAVQTAASQLIEFCLNPGEWPLEELPVVDLWDPVTPSQASTDSSANGSLKRSLDAETIAEPHENSKRAKHGPTNLEFPGTQDAETSHVSDSVASQQAMKALKDERDALLWQVKELDAAFRDAQAQLQEHVRALETLQYDHEEQREKLAEKDAALLKCVEKAQIDARRFTSLDTRYNNVREECSELKKQLVDAKEALLTQAIPEKVDFEKLKGQAEAATAECVKLRSKVKQAEENYDYLREQYQAASSSASQLSGEKSALEAENGELQKKASGEHLKLRTKSLDMYTQHLRSENQQLKLTLKSREELLLRREEELSRFKDGRGRMTTRGSSVPRSPRVGSPLAQGTRSRQASPAAGKAPHPLRNG